MAISNNNVGIRPGVCTSSTRPTAPYEGQMIYETDTDKVLVWDGSAWYPSKNRAWGLLGRHELSTVFSTSATHTTFQDDGLSNTINYGPNRLLKINVSFRPYPSGGLQIVACRILRTSNSSVVCAWSYGEADVSSVHAPQKFFSYVFTGPSTAGTDTFKLQIAATSANTQVTSYASSGDGTRLFWIEDIGPA